ncbi:MAG: hypothetical protein WBP81_24390 [Solirubrobacteraceae bacterium]
MFDAHVTGVVLLETLQAPSAGRGHVRLPVGAKHPAVAPDADEDAPVDHGDQVRVCGQVEDGAWLGTIDAAEEHIAVECLLPSGLFDHAVFERVDRGMLRGGAVEQGATEYRDLGPGETHVGVGGVEQAVEVVGLDGVEVDQDQVLDPDAGERFGNHRADAAGPDDSDAEAGKVGLHALSP